MHSYLKLIWSLLLLTKSCGSIFQLVRLHWISLNLSSTLCPALSHILLICFFYHESLWRILLYLDFSRVLDEISLWVATLSSLLGIITKAKSRTVFFKSTQILFPYLAFFYSLPLLLSESPYRDYVAITAHFFSLVPLSIFYVSPFL